LPLIGSIGQPAEFAVPKFWVMTVPGRTPFETEEDFRKGACAFPSAAASPYIEMMGAAEV
jgi:hypothetical protein